MKIILNFIMAWTGFLVAYHNVSILIGFLMTAIAIFNLAYLTDYDKPRDNGER